MRGVSFAWRWILYIKTLKEQVDRTERVNKEKGEGEGICGGHGEEKLKRIIGRRGRMVRKCRGTHTPFR